MSAQMNEDPFNTTFRGYFTGVLSWEDLDVFWGVVRSNAGAGWYVYAIGETPPTAPATAEQVNYFSVKSTHCCARSTKRTIAASYTLTAKPNPP